MAAKDGRLSEEAIDALLADPAKLNPPEALAQVQDMGYSDADAKKALGLADGGDHPAGGDGGGSAGREPADGGAAEGGQADEAGAAAGTAEDDDSPAQPSDDPATKAVRLEAEVGVLREVLKLLPQLAGPKEPVKAPEPPPKPAQVQQWERLAAVSAADARAHVEKLTADGNTFDAGRFQSAWENAPSHLDNWRQQEAFQKQVEVSAAATRQTQVDAEIASLAKAHPDWEKYADKMEKIAANDRRAQMAGAPPAYASVEDVYWAARGSVDRGAAPAALSPKAAAAKAALGKGPGSKRGGIAAPAGAGAKPDPEQSLIRSLLAADQRF